MCFCDGRILQVQALPQHAEEMGFSQSHLVEPSTFSKELSTLLGAGVRAARTARCLHGKVVAGDIVLLRDSTVALCKAAIHKEGEVEVQLVMQRAERCRRAVASFLYVETK